MSVQAGVWYFNDGQGDERFLDRMSDALAQYGPDGNNRYWSGSCGVLYMPFFTTRESRAEQQPYVSLHENVVTWDGRLDNRSELISKLGGDLKGETTDVAIVSAAYERWSTNSFPLFLGDWAISIWDPREKTLVLARDYIGVRQLFYSMQPEKVIWCTRLEPLILHSNISFTLCDEYVAGYLSMYPAAHLTPFREVQAVQPGGFARIRPGGVEISSYWTLNPKMQTRLSSDAEYEEHFRQLFRQAIRRRLRSDSPLLAELSGGLDSSSIVCMADDVIAKGEAETPRLDTLSYYDPQSPQTDERPFIARVEEKRGRVGYHIPPTEESRRLSLDFPVFAPIPGALPRAQIPTTFPQVCDELAPQKKYRSVLSGAGGDEFLGGAFDPRPDLADLIAQLRLRQLFRDLMTWSLALRQPWIHLLLQSFVFLLPPSLRSRLDSQAKLENWINPRFARKYKLSARQFAPPDMLYRWLPSARTTALTVASITYYLSRHQPYENPQEKRYPYLDQTLFEFLISIPSNQTFRPGQRRSLMRRALVDLVPTEVLFRKTKGTGTRHYMTALDSSWVELESIFGSLFSSRLGYIDGNRFKEALVEVRMGKPDSMVRTLKGLSLELWLRDLVKRGIIRIPTGELPTFRTEAVQSGA